MRGDTVEAPVLTAQRAHARSPRPPTAVPRPRNRDIPLPPFAPSVHLAPCGLPVCIFCFQRVFLAINKSERRDGFFGLRASPLAADALPPPVYF